MAAAHLPHPFFADMDCPEAAQQLGIAVKLRNFEMFVPFGFAEKRGGIGGVDFDRARRSAVGIGHQEEISGHGDLHLRPRPCRSAFESLHRAPYASGVLRTSKLVRGCSEPTASQHRPAASAQESVTARREAGLGG